MAACATARSWQNEIINPGKDSLLQPYWPLTQQVVFQSWYYLLADLGSNKSRRYYCRCRRNHHRKVVMKKWDDLKNIKRVLLSNLNSLQLSTQTLLQKYRVSVVIAVLSQVQWEHRLCHTNKGGWLRQDKI
jgi:hypothetical protein